MGYVAGTSTGGAGSPRLRARACTLGGERSSGLRFGTVAVLRLGLVVLEWRRPFASPIPRLGLLVAWLELRPPFVVPVPRLLPPVASG